jgi:2-keto-4-pentenoate hydratase/2-oxohepta-3-ene-1,7-dioic acid hydratase in catechol pathway
MRAVERLYRVSHGGRVFHAVEREEDGGQLRVAVPAKGDDIDIFSRGYSAGTPIAGGLAAVTVLAPVRPTKIVCVGLNYRDHAFEIGKPLPADPLLFIKPSTAVLDPGASIKLPPGVGRVDYEGELAVVIGRRAHRVPAARAWDYILGLTCVNDVTARDLQNKDSQYTRCKGFDTFAPVGPSIAVGLGGPGKALSVQTWLNGARRQASDTSQLIFGIEALVEFITFVMTLEPGDIISTGTPSGIGPLTHGDRVTVSVEGVGELTNPVQAEGLTVH